MKFLAPHFSYVFLIWQARKSIETAKDRKQQLPTLQSRAYLLASIMAAFRSLSDSKTNTKDCPFLTCQNSDLAAELPPPLNPHSWIEEREK